LKNKGFNLLKIALSLALLVIILSQINLADLWNELRDIDLALLGLAQAAYLVGIGIRAYRWQLLFRALGEQVSFWRLAELYLVGMFFNHFLPTGIGGDVVKVYEVSRRESHASSAISATLADRLTGILGSSLIALIAVLVDRRDVPRPIIQAVFIVSFGIVAGTLLFTQRQWWDALFARMGLLKRVTSVPRVQRLYQALTGYTMGDILRTMLVSLPFTITLILTQVLIARSLGVDLALRYFLLFVPLIALANVLPISFNGLGVREGTYQLLFVPVGVSVTAAVAMSLIFHVVRLIVGLLGGVVYIFSGIREQVNDGLRQTIDKAETGAGDHQGN
jgi:uncharacterized protein (TIRG00374 family)